MIKINLRSPAHLVKYRDAYGYGRVYWTLYELLKKRTDIVFVDDYKQADIQVCLALPHNRWEYFHWWARKRHPVQVVYCTWETTKIPVGWKDNLNSVAATFTTSKWCCDVLKDNGVTTPIYNVPHGIDPKSFPYMGRDWNAKPFFFLWQGMHPNDRKGRRYVEQAFEELNLPDAWLIEKWYPMISREWKAIYHDRRIMEIGQFMRGVHYKEFLKSCHASINPFRGEGFGMLPLETAATGMATAATAWSGSTEYMTNGYFYPIKHDMSELGQDYISTVAFTDCRTEPAQDAIPRIESIKAAMLHFYRCRKDAEAMGREASEFIHKNWTWDRAADIFVDSIKEVLNVRQ